MTYTEQHLAMVAQMMDRNPPDGWSYKSMMHFLAAEGRAYAPPTAPYQMPSRFHVLPNQCFDNAYRLARRSRRLRYCEGYALSVIPMHHAWCLTDDDVVVDPTWQAFSTPGAEYVGVPIALDIMASIRSSRCLSGLDNFARGWPMLRAPYDREGNARRMMNPPGKRAA